MNIYTVDNIPDLKLILEKHGVAILKDYFTGAYADNVFNSVKEWLIDLDIGLTDDVSTWISKNTPFGPRFGMYQSIISHAPKFWELREKMYPIFQELLDESDILCSIDGASFYPTINSPKSRTSWEHIDQTISSDLICYQSQFIASNTKASFICTPGSHKKHGHIIKKFTIETNSNWHKFNDDQISILKKRFGELYQIPIYAPKGSIIFWDSRTIHAAKYPDNKENRWRAVFYISMRPKKSFNKKNKDIIKYAAINGKTTNHWGNKIFKPMDRFKIKNNKVVLLEQNSKDLSLVESFTKKQKKMVGLQKID